jgi:hypothetical protein
MIMMIRGIKSISVKLSFAHINFAYRVSINLYLDNNSLYQIYNYPCNYFYYLIIQDDFLSKNYSLELKYQISKFKKKISMIHFFR